MNRTLLVGCTIAIIGLVMPFHSRGVMLAGTALCWIGGGVMGLGVWRLVFDGRDRGA